MRRDAVESEVCEGREQVAVEPLLLCGQGARLVVVGAAKTGAVASRIVVSIRLRDTQNDPARHPSIRVKAEILSLCDLLDYQAKTAL
jgi:hypothetical protein